MTNSDTLQDIAGYRSEVRIYKKKRKCQCGRVLNSYNPGPQCFSCQRKEYLVVSLQDAPNESLL